MAAQQSIAGLIGIFDLPLGSENMPVGESMFQESTEESTFDPDFRTLVDPTEYQDGGIYRCEHYTYLLIQSYPQKLTPGFTPAIVKLQMRYEGQDENSNGWYMGTGWLIAPDIMATAGHNVYNWGGGLGKATTIKCHIGYYGQESIGKAGVQTRHAKRCVTSAEWLQSKDNRHRDFAFIQVDRPFTGNLRIFSFAKTPPYGHEMLGIVGYPGDQHIKDSYGRPEKGAMMYKEFDKVKYDRRAPATQGMLSYRVSTYGGQSGSPVIREGTQTGIATHVYGLGNNSPNQASPITDYDNFFNAFNQNLPTAGEVDGIALHKPIAATSGVSTLGGITNAPVPVPNGKVLLSMGSTLQNKNNASGQEESFIDILKGIGSVVSTVGGAVAPTLATALLGPAGAPVAAIAGVALGALGNVCESTLDTNEGVPERAVLSEAALQTVLKLQEHNPSHPALRKIHSDMAESYRQIAPAVPHLAETLKPALFQAAAIVGQAGDVSNNKGPLGHTKVANGEEAFFQDAGNFLYNGFQVAKPILRAGAVAALNKIATGLAAESGQQESTLDSRESSEASQAAKLVVQRAFLGDSALQALGKLDPRELAGLKVPSEGAAQEESIADFFNTAVQKIGGVVKTVAPVVIDHVLPAVVKAVAGYAQESAPETARPERVLNTKRSGFLMYNNEHQDSTRNQSFLKVSALLPTHGTMTADIVREERESARVHKKDSNEDLPVYHEYN